jgi:EAL domain-containing protein (putative c-di-GMP-specific phosphodiesterase class I)
MSSFGYLRHLPVDFIKIDGSFVKDIADDAVDLATVRAINDVGHVMGKQTIAEFVSDEAGLAALREIGVDYAQGNWLSHPAPFLVPAPEVARQRRTGPAGRRPAVAGTIAPAAVGSIST